MDSVPRHMDRHLQRIMDNATSSNDRNRSGDYAFGDARSAECRLREAPRQSDEAMLLDSGLPGIETSHLSSTSFGNMRDRGSCTFESSRQPSSTINSSPSLGRGPYSFNPVRKLSTASATALTRLSFAPQNTCSQQDSKPRNITNADNHFRFAQNLRHGLSMNRAPPQRPPVHNFDSQQQAQSPLTQLANNMLLQRTTLQAGPEQADSYMGKGLNRINQLQPRRQERTPPFNLSGFVFSPKLQNPVNSSSPPANLSSPTTRLSLRQASNSVTATSGVPKENSGYENAYDLLEARPATPQRQITTFMTSAIKRMPQALALEHAPPIAHGIQLVSPHELPDRFRQVFPYELFNAAQSKCFDPIYKSNDNVVVSAPTGSGKTALLELAICKLVEGHPSGQFKIVYQAPTKSLCSERIRDWQKKFSHLNLACAELTGDTSQAEMSRVGAASIIITTPEKWDSITRKWKDYSRLLQLLKLFLIDEVHILKDTRGATLEAVVSRMKASSANVRFLALSATVPNSHDVAVWLGKDHANDHIPAHLETFGEDFRPVKLQKFVYGFDGLPNDFAFEKTLDGKLPNLIQKYSQKRPMMIFCFTRKSCETTAGILAEWWTRQRGMDRAWPVPAQMPVVGSKELQELVGCGVAFHHAGLDPQDRHAIETAFLKGNVSLICCTSTLAIGVNLPCHLVVLKGTVCFQDGALCEYSDLEVMQMLGRAGRPQFDDSAVAIIMTRSEKADRYKKMISGQDVLESTLHLTLIEHLNSEIGLGTVMDLYTAKKWLMGTFLRVRMRQNPDHYKLDGILPSRDADERLGLVCERDIQLLEDHELVRRNGDRLSGTEYGEAMSRYMVQFETMKLLLGLPEGASTEQILYLLCQAIEFKDLRMKPNERSSLREFNKSPFIKFPIKENISTTAHKISLMIQIQLGAVDLLSNKDFSIIRRQFLMEKCIIFERIQRLVRCVVECRAYQCDAISTRHALDLARSLSAEVWENSNLQLRQVPQIGPVALRKLVSSDINSIEKLMSQDTANIERIVGKNPPFGRKTLDILAGFPTLRITGQVIGRPVIKAGQKPQVNVKVQLGFLNAKIPAWNSRRPSLTFLAETSYGKLVHFWRGNISRLDKGFDLKFCVQLDSPHDIIQCHVACDEIVGTLRYCRLEPDVPVSLFPPPKPKQSMLPISKAESKPKSKQADEFGTDEIEDDELLAAVEEVDASGSEPESDGFANIDDFARFPIEEGTEKVKSGPTGSVQMNNGKWTCNHSCRGGKILKNGQMCKHKCCKDGLNKRPGPRRPRTKSFIGTGELLPSLKSQKQASKFGQVVIKEKSGSNKTRFPAKSLRSRAFTNEPVVSRTKLSAAKHAKSDECHVEVVDLADEFSPVPYSKVADQDYRKLEALHTSNNKSATSVRFSEGKSQYSYASTEAPDLPFLRDAKVKDDDDIFAVEASDGEDLPSPSAIARFMKEDINRPSKSGSMSYDGTLQSSVIDDSLETIEEVILDASDPTPSRELTPNLNSSFANGIFDFDAFEDDCREPNVYSSPLISASRKRVRSRSPSLPEMKHCRLSGGHNGISFVGIPDLQQKPTYSEAPMVESRRINSQDLVGKPKDSGLFSSKQLDALQPKGRQTQVRAVPDWVNEFDPDLIESLIGVVDFVE